MDRRKLNIVYYIKKIKKYGIRKSVRILFGKVRNKKTLVSNSIKIVKLVIKRVRIILKRILKLDNNYLYAFYDLAACPVTYDIANFLFMAENARLESGKKYLYIIIVPGYEKYQGYRENTLVIYNSMSKSDINQDNLHWRKHQILIPMLRLLPSVKGFTLCSDRIDAKKHWEKRAYFSMYPKNYILNPPTAAYSIKHLLRVPKSTKSTFEATQEAKKYIREWISINKLQDKKLITITLRTSLYETNRNSNIKEWIKFADVIDKKKYFPVFVQDTETAFLPLSELHKKYIIFKEISWNIELRMALYELSYLNLTINNGCTSLAYYNKAVRFISFKQISGNGATSIEYYISQGLTPGSQYPFFTKYQKIVWEDDNFDVIKREYERMCKIIEVNN